MTPVANVSELSARFDPQLLALLRGLDLKARYVVEGFFSGLHESPFHGFSVEFSDYRNYEPGDDLRHIDWRVYARSDRLYVKRFKDETNTRCCVICDGSDSMSYRGRAAWASKMECAKILAAAMTLLMLHQRDAVGSIMLRAGENGPEFLRPSQKPYQFGRMIRRLEDLQPGSGPQLPVLLRHAVRLLKRRGIIFIFSDLLDPPETLAEELRQLRFVGHECIIFQVLDRDELEFPFERGTIFEDLETGVRRSMSLAGARRTYLRRFRDFMAEHRDMFRSLEIQHSLVRNDEDPWHALAEFFVRRRQLE